MRELKEKGKTVIIVSHDLYFHSVSDKILCYSGINDYQYDTHENLKSTPGIYKQLWDANTRLYD